MAVDSSDRSIIIFQPQQQPVFLSHDAALSVLPGVDLTLTAQQVFDWLSMG